MDDVRFPDFMQRERERLRPCCTDGARKRGDANLVWVYAIRT
jgi:hypothetical protein